jgi:hypothetical protein
MLRVPVLCAIALAGAFTVTACTSGSTPAPVTTTQTITRTQAPPPPPSSSGTPTGPIAAGPTTTAEATCPLLDEPTAADALGQRLDRITVQTAGGKTVGCRFYDVQGTDLATSEHLSGPNQPALQISSATYATPTLAHNAMVMTAEKGVNAHPVNGGIAYLTTFDPADGPNKDWAYAVTKGTTLVVIETNQGDAELDAERVATAIAGKV